MSEFLSALLGFAMLAALAVIAGLAVQWMLGILQTGGKAADAFNVLLLAALGGVGYLYRSSRDQRQQLEARLASAKRERYEAYVDILKDMVSTTKKGASLDPNLYIPKLREFAFRSILVASDPVVMAHIRMTNVERIAPVDPAMMLPAVGDVLVALRKDIGFSGTKLTNQQILGIFMNDIDATPEPFQKWTKARATWDQRMGWTNRWRSKN